MSATKSRLFWINFILFAINSVVLLVLLFPGRPGFIGLLAKNIDLFNIAEFFFLLIAWYSVKKRHDRAGPIMKGHLAINL